MAHKRSPQHRLSRAVSPSESIDSAREYLERSLGRKEASRILGIAKKIAEDMPQSRPVRTLV